MATRNGVDSWGTVRMASLPWEPLAADPSERDTIPDMIWDDETEPEITMKIVKAVRPTFCNAVRVSMARALLKLGLPRLAWRVAP